MTNLCGKFDFEVHQRNIFQFFLILSFKHPKSGELISELPPAHPLRFFGCTLLMADDPPPLELCDLDLIQKVMVKDFAHFTDRIPEDAVNHLCNPSFLSDRIFKKGLLFLRGTCENLRNNRSPASQTAHKHTCQISVDFR